MKIIRKPKVLILDGLKDFPIGETLKNNLNNHAKVELLKLHDQKTVSNYKIKRKLNDIEIKIKKKYKHIKKLDEKLLIDKIRIYTPEIILVIFGLYRSIDPKVIKNYCNKYKVKMILYDTDGLNIYDNGKGEFNFFLEKELNNYDKVISFSKVFVNYLSTIKNINAVYIPYGCEIKESSITNKFYQNDIVFFGAADLRRIFYLEAVSEKTKIFGNRWEKYKDIITPNLYTKINNGLFYGDALYKIIDSSKIVLNITKSNYFSLGGGSNLRIFEALGRNLFVLSDKNSELADLLKIGHEIEVFESPSELLEKTNYYLKNETKRNFIANNGFLKVKKMFSWEKIAKDILKEIID